MEFLGRSDDLEGDGETAIAYRMLSLNKQAVYHPRALVYHEIPKGRLTLSYFRKRAYLEGISASFTQLRSTQSRSKPQLMADACQ